MSKEDWNNKEPFFIYTDIDAEKEGHPNNRAGVRLHYHRKAIWPYIESRTNIIVDKLQIKPPLNIVIVGAGFGWTAECLIGRGFNVISTEPSEWIHQVKLTDEHQEIVECIRKVGLIETEGKGKEIHNKFCECGLPRSRSILLKEDLTTDVSVNNVLAAMEGKADYAISEFVISCLSNSDCIALSTNMHRIANKVVHFEHAIEHHGVDDRFNMKYGKDWKAVMPDDIFVFQETKEII